MSQNKLMTGLLVGAAVGIIVSLLDRNTRDDVIQKSKKATNNAKYYASNRDELVQAFQQQAERAQNLYSRISEDASYVGSKVNELKEMTPQVKEMALETKEAFMDTKDAVIETKDDVISAVKEDNPSPTSSLTDSSNSSTGSGNNSSSNKSSGTGYQSGSNSNTGNRS
ncbi:YtxH domain-containing protein [Microbacterium sp. APC 3898]|uniref:YtxH domain-containing protein n=2 Tax=Planococcus TaxID=1372 RepID=A0ABT7ZNY4_9BACL|nr:MULTISPECIES: YtxH domain-containing protein [Terrabacteria group]MBF6634604.1 YtxH domain-containing protein [Planococcus sp. (in: firmicutes)]MBD8016605.1 YtxH domain-containing protein [Planococcus wigleyi]MDN3428894.1 YtxH domain-containing protein [Planococcus sp. APC 4016]MDN3439699.1 YtxH domain-containing protein [Planococcus sp. APC 3900]MDN3500664.1 YtxH domain-containing protein [Microbacterium sp. APC 3898]